MTAEATQTLWACLKQMTWEARVKRVILEIKWALQRRRPRALFFAALGFSLRHLYTPESYSDMKARQAKELEIFQSHCKHKHLSFRYTPFVVCSNCQKVIRISTDKEQKIETENYLQAISIEVNKVLEEREQNCENTN